MEKQKSRLASLHEESANHRADSQKWEANWLAVDSINTDLNNQCIKIRQTLNIGKDSNGRFIQRTKKLTQQAIELGVMTSLRPKMTKWIEKKME